MKNEYVFKRYELKYLLSQEQYQKVIDEVKKHATPDDYALSSIRNIYYDTENRVIIRNSLEKPIYKEKLRIRSYEDVNDKSLIYLEMKNKYNGVVYKRRCKIKYGDAKRLLEYKLKPTTQIMKEISTFSHRYEKVNPAMFLSYDRIAYCDIERCDLRITFDYNIIYRDYDLDLSYGIYGERILDENQYLMEIKTATSIPLWLVKVLSENKIYKISFSKYGTAYTRCNCLKEKTINGTNF